MILFGQLFQHEFVNSHNFLGESLVLFETFRHECNLDNEEEIGGHHSDWSEQVSQVIGQLGTTSVTGIHSDEEASVLGDQNNLVQDIALFLITLL
jgi:hypothetical protein